MSRTGRIAIAIALVAYAAIAAGCSNGLKLEDLQSGATGALSAIPAAAKSLVPTAIKQPVGSATEVYTRVARGALTCWLGPYGSLKKTHLFQAEAQPRSEGGAAQIAIHERIQGSPNQPGRKVFKIDIAPVGEKASVTAENLGLPQKQGDAMRADVERWAAADEGCLAKPIADGWNAAEHPSKRKITAKTSTKARSASKSKTAK